MSQDYFNQTYREIVKRFDLGGPALVEIWKVSGVQVRNRGEKDKDMTLYHALRFLRPIGHDDYLLLTSNKLKRFIAALIQSKGETIKGMALSVLLEQLHSLE